MKAYSLFLLDPIIMGTNRIDELNPVEYRNYHSYKGHDKTQYDRVYVFVENEYIDNNGRMLDKYAHYYHLLIDSLSEKVKDGTVSNVNALKYVFFDVKKNTFYVGRITNLLTAEPDVEDMELRYGYRLDNRSFVDRPCIFCKDKLIDILDNIEIADIAKWYGHDFMYLTDEYKVDAYATKKYRPRWIIKRLISKINLIKLLIKYIDSSVKLHSKWPFGEIVKIDKESERIRNESVMRDWVAERKQTNGNVKNIKETEE